MLVEILELYPDGSEELVRELSGEYLFSYFKEADSVPLLPSAFSRYDAQVILRREDLSFRTHFYKAYRVRCGTNQFDFPAIPGWKEP